MRFFLRLAYNGTRFHGWQRQPNAVSVQQCLEEALSTVCRHPVELTGAGRTDAGVHARMMYAHFDTHEIPDTDRFLKSVDRMAGPDIAVQDILRVTPAAHARFDAISRSYAYYIIFRKDPFMKEIAFRMSSCPDIDLMNEAATILTENEDFTSFSKLHTDVKTNKCRVTRAEWSFQDDGRILRFDITADRFLRNMVRAVVGTLLEVGAGKISKEEFIRIIEAKDRCEAGVSVPAQGLFLNEIVYPSEIFFT